MMGSARKALPKAKWRFLARYEDGEEVWLSSGWREADPLAALDDHAQAHPELKTQHLGLFYKEGSVAWRGYTGSSRPAGGLPIGQVGFGPCGMMDRALFFFWKAVSLPTPRGEGPHWPGGRRRARE